ncbi:MAG: hypothetical protein KAR07_04080 [Spirochaetes bacterium]|nr:hypothetical protein [Spirochaetota bacterium]
MSGNEYTLFDEVKMEKGGVTFTGVKIKRALDENGYCIKSVVSPQEVRGFITEQTYQAIIAGEEVTVYV